MIASPSKYTSLARLEQIAKDNYLGESGQEYSAEEVDALILDKKIRAGHSMAEDAIKRQNAAAKMQELCDFFESVKSEDKKEKRDMKYFVDAEIDRLRASGHQWIIRERIEEKFKILLKDNLLQ